MSSSAVWDAYTSLVCDQITGSRGKSQYPAILMCGNALWQTMFDIEPGSHATRGG